MVTPNFDKMKVSDLPSRYKEYPFSQDSLKKRAVERCRLREKGKDIDIDNERLKGEMRENDIEIEGGRKEEGERILNGS